MTMFSVLPSEANRAAAADRMRFWRPLPWKVADVVCGEGTANGVTPLHAHEALQLLLPIAPLAVMNGERRGVVVSPGCVHITSPLDTCAVRSLDGRPFRTRLMLVGPTLLAKAGLTSSPNQTLRGPDIVRDASIHAELTSVFEELQRPLIDVECSSRVIATLRRLLPHASSQPRPLSDIAAAHPVGVFRTRDYLREHAVTPVTLDELASVAALSKFYLIRAFQHAFGLTPHSYQMQLRLARARRLLAEGRPLSHVTYDAGFADQSHLTRRFAAFYGLTPARYARQVTMGHCTTLAPAASASWSPSSAA